MVCYSKNVLRNMEMKRLISILSHDIVMPLKFLYLTSKNLLEAGMQMNEVQQKEVLHDIVQTTLSLEIISRNILNWLSFQWNPALPEKQAINLRQSLQESLTMLRILAKHKKIKINYEIQEAKFNYNYGEPMRIIVYNLVLNAIRAMDQGHIHIRGRQLKRGFFIEVQDQGYGMTLSQIRAILSHKKQQVFPEISGTAGLGYLIIRDLLKMTGGRFFIHSRLQNGTKIRLFFPSLVTAEIAFMSATT